MVQGQKFPFFGKFTAIFALGKHPNHFLSESLSSNASYFNLIIHACTERGKHM